MKHKNARNHTLSIYQHYHKPCPNAAEPSYFLAKFVDGLLAVVTVMGAITFFCLLITM